MPVALGVSEATVATVVVATITAGGPIIALLIRNRQGHKVTHRQLKDLAIHVNNVEEDIDHSTGPTLGQRVKQMDIRQQNINSEFLSFIEETRRVHRLLLDATPETTITLFKQAFINSDEPAFHSVAEPGTDPPWKVNWANRAWFRLVDLSPEEVATHQYIADIHPDDIRRVMTAARRSWDEGTVLQIRYRVRSEEGRWQPIEVHAEPYRNLRGDLLGQLGVIRIIPS
ncbi:MAG: PAS domain-containing protein [Phycisphaerales bacterium]